MTRELPVAAGEPSATLSDSERKDPGVDAIGVAVYAREPARTREFELGVGSEAKLVIPR